MSQPRLSVIVPTLDEERALRAFLTELVSIPEIDEVIVVDGGSSDGTVAIAGAFPTVRVLRCATGRATQMNAGARAARGEVLVFLHADVGLPVDAARWIRAALDDGRVVAGAFRTWTVADGPAGWVGPLLHLADLRSRYTRLPYGDQAIFVRAACFSRIGGFPDLPILEDRELCRRLRRVGEIRTVPVSVRVSGRRFQARPVSATVLTNLIPAPVRPRRLSAAPGACLCRDSLRSCRAAATRSTSGERELDPGLCGPPADLQDRVGQEVDRARPRSRLDDQVPSSAQLEPIGWMVPEVVGREARVLVGLADVDGPPAAVGVELGPAVIPIRERSGAVTGAVVVFKDISTIKELERLRKEWTSIVAHDLRQPLALISMNSALLATKVDSPEQQKRIARILDSVGRLNRMIADLLDLSRLEVKDLPLAREELDPGPFVQAVVDRARDTIGEREIRVSVSASLPHVQADPGRVEQILTNLLTNAAQYGENGTPIDVTVDHTDSEVVIAVTNRGPGIAPEDLPNLFQRFKRAERTHRKGVESIGLGLYITKGLVESHGGRIWAESIPGAETTFTLTLPQSASQVT